MLSELPDTAPVDDSAAPATVPVAGDCARGVHARREHVGAVYVVAQQLVAAHFALRGEPVQRGQAREGQNKNAETVGRATKRAAKQLTGDDGNFVVTTDLGNEFATQEAACGSRAPDEAARGPQRHCRGGPGHPDAEEGPGHEGGAQGGQWSNHFKRAEGVYNARPHEAVHGTPEDVEKRCRTRAPSERRRTRRGAQPSVRRRAAAGGRGLHDRPQHGGARDPAEAGAAGAAGQRQRGGPADETGQAGGCKAAGRFPGPPRPRTSLKMIFLGTTRPPCVQGTLIGPPFGAKKPRKRC